MSLIRKHGAVLQAWACLDLVIVAAKILFFCFCWGTLSAPVLVLTQRVSGRVLGRPMTGTLCWLDDSMTTMDVCDSKFPPVNSFGAEVAKSRHNGLSTEVDYSRPLGGECCMTIPGTVCRQKSPRRYILNLLLMVEIKSALFELCCVVIVWLAGCRCLCVRPSSVTSTAVSLRRSCATKDFTSHRARTMDRSVPSILSSLQLSSSQLAAALSSFSRLTRYLLQLRLLLPAEATAVLFSASSELMKFCMNIYLDNFGKPLNIKVRGQGHMGSLCA